MSIVPKKFQIIKFLSATGGDEEEEAEHLIDIVPKTWIMPTKEGGALTWFMPPPYTPNKCRDLQKLVEKYQDPDKKEWLCYSVSLVGQAGEFSVFPILLTSKLSHFCKVSHCNYSHSFLYLSRSSRSSENIYFKS